MVDTAATSLPAESYTTVLSTIRCSPCRSLPRVVRIVTWLESGLTTGVVMYVPHSATCSGSVVRLVTTDPLHVAEWGTYITTPVVSPDSSQVTIRTTLGNERHGEQRIVLSTVVYDSAGREVAAVSTMGRIAGDSVAELAQDLTIPRPVLWSVERPYLYRVVSRVRCGNRVCDTYTTPFGVRSFVFRADSGFFLNGRPVKIRGVCLHHDLGALGAAVNTQIGRAHV